jgi:hypothetical protein
MQEAFVEQMGEFNRQFARRPGSYHLFFGHFGVAGARVSSAQPLVGRCAEYPLEPLRCDLTKGYRCRIVRIMLPRRPAKVLCFHTTATPGKKGVKAIRCRDSGSKAHLCQESDSDSAKGTRLAASRPSFSLYSTGIQVACGIRRLSASMALSGAFTLALRQAFRRTVQTEPTHGWPEGCPRQLPISGRPASQA